LSAYFAILAKLNDADLRELGVTSLGHRKRLLVAALGRCRMLLAPLAWAEVLPPLFRRWVRYALKEAKALLDEISV